MPTLVTTWTSIAVDAPQPARLRAMVRVDGAAACFVTLRASGRVVLAPRCRSAIPTLRRAVSWHWQGQNLLILDATGGALFLFKPAGPNHWRAEPAAGKVLDLYPMTPEAQPSRT